MIEENGNKNYYEILEIPSNATPEQIHEGYQRAKNAYGQDSLALYSLMSKDECQSVLNIIEEAYGIISDPSKRAQYDSARGIQNTYSTPTYQAELHARQELEKKQEPQNKISKIVATNKYSLSYDANPDFEQVIEQTTEFTGEFLKKVREYRNVDVPRMAEMTKVSKAYLRNIEEEKSS